MLKLMGKKNIHSFMIKRIAYLDLCKISQTKSSALVIIDTESVVDDL